jgi:dipeptidyl aminopeptidase/acylaminoacyl peptidase
MKLPSALALVALMTAPAPAADERPMTVDDLLAVKSVGDPRVSPDGKTVAYVVSEIDRDAGKTNSSLWLVPSDGSAGPRRLTTAPGTNNHPRWKPDGSAVAFLSNRGGSSQVWLLPLDGGEASQVTKLPIDVTGFVWSPKGDAMVLTAEVYPGSSPEETAKKEKEESKSKARVYDELMIRHWMSWDEGKRSHVFHYELAKGEAKDLIPDWKANVPPAPFGGSEEIAISPDGKTVAFTSEPLTEAAWSTNKDIWTIGVDGSGLKNQTAENLGADGLPAFAPFDGQILFHVSQARAGFEADQWVLCQRHLGADRSSPITKELDRPVQSFVVDSRAGILAVIDDNGTEPIVSVGLVIIGSASNIVGAGKPERRITGGVNTAVDAVKAGDRMVYLHASAAHPGEVYSAKLDGSDAKRLTDHNGPLLASLDLPEAEGFTFEGADGDEVSGWLVKPPGFDASRRYPVVFLIHGGPQGAWHDEWHARWNYHLFGAPGYAVVAINPRGSTGYGQEFTDQISQDWGGKVYVDLMRGLDAALERYPFLDGDRVAAAGGSYGGYMVNWIAGHTGRFRALISHAGIFDLLSMNITTEELWFPEWEFGGSPWEKPERQYELSPSKYVEHFQTPTLVIHGALDFRVPDAQGLGMFTALQRRGVPSRYLWFPDEGHWISKPANRVAWWAQVHEWLARYLKDE